MTLDEVCKTVLELDDTIKRVLELDEKAKWLTYPKLMAGGPTPINDSYTAPICIGTLKEICEALESYRTSAPILAKACQRMKEALERMADKNFECTKRCEHVSKAALADIEEMFGDGK